LSEKYRLSWVTQPLKCGSFSLDPTKLMFFLLAGAPNPSAFYVVIQVVLFLSNTGAILGFDKVLSH